MPKIPKVGFIITSEISFRNLIQLLSTIFKEIFDNQEVQDQLKEYPGRIDECSKNRNLVAHSLWTPELDFIKEVKGDVIRRLKYTAKRNRGVKMQWENYTLDDLNNISKYIKALIDEITEFMDSVIVSLQWIDYSDAGKELPMKIEPHINEHNGKTYYMPAESPREKSIMDKAEAYLRKLKEDRNNSG